MGIGVGSTVAELKARYPAATESGSGFAVVTKGTPSWTYVFLTDGFQDPDQVKTIRMQLESPECFLG
jgi:hypothetical protein